MDENLNLLFLGELDIHARSFLPFLDRRGYDVTVVNTSHWYFPPRIEGGISVSNLYQKSKKRFLFSGRLQWFIKAVLYSLAETSSKSANEIKHIIKQNQIDAIYGSWGSHSLPELRLVRKFSVPIVYEFLTYPYQEFSPAIKVENFLNKSIIIKLEGRVCSTQRMLNYLKKTFDIRYGENILFAECYPREFFYRKRLSPLSERDGNPHLIFIGLDVSDVFPQIEEIIRREIHAHICCTKGLEPKLKSIKFQKFIHIFKKFNYSELINGTFATFMTQFDACLVTYNFKKSSVLDRFCNSIPNRFSFALTAGIPIVLPKGYLKSCEDLVEEHQIGFAYTNFDELKKKLSNIELMNSFRRNAIEKSKNFTLENNFEKLHRFLTQIVDAS